MSKLKFVVPGLVLLGGVAISALSSYAKPAYMKDTGKKCNFCHVNATSKDKEEQKKLTPAGTYFKEHKNSLEGYKES